MHKYCLNMECIYL